MESLVQTLRTQHRAAEALAGQIDRAVADRDVARIRTLLEELATALNAHLRIEDTRLYPELQRLAREGGKQNLVEIVGSFSSSMAAISVTLSRFFDRHRKPEWSLETFAAEWRTISATLATRISTEETSLYPLHERLTRRATVAPVVTAPKRAP